MTSEMLEKEKIINSEEEKVTKVPTSEEVVLSVKKSFEENVKPDWIEWTKEIAVFKRCYT